MVLSDKQLREWGYSGGLEPFLSANVNPASVDLRWSGRWREGTELRMSEWEQDLGGDRYKLLLPNTFYMLDTVEYIVMPINCCGFLTLKSSMGRQGLFQAHTGFVDPGFEGTLTFEVVVQTPWHIVLQPWERVVQLVLMQMQSEPEAAYNGHYQGSQEPMAAWAVAGDGHED